MFPVAVWVVPKAGVNSTAVRFPVAHPYAETLWLPVIGPSATLVLRRLGAWAEACPDGLTVQLPELSEALGFGGASGPGSSVQRTLRRLLTFGLATWSGRLEVATTIPPLADRQLRRLSPGLVRTHDRMLAATSGWRAA